MVKPGHQPNRLFFGTAAIITSLILGLHLYAALTATSFALPGLAILADSLAHKNTPASCEAGEFIALGAKA
ncbi:MAG: hypothetical protein RL095_1410 [Verrucomicrobiota bacterium]|jgi:hypothetical protein